MKFIEVAQPGVDAQGRWLKKAGKLHYGYKRHITMDEDGMIEAVYTTAANDEALASQGIKNRIQEKGLRNRALTPCCNKLISEQRYKVEGSFAGLKKWFGGGICRYSRHGKDSRPA